MIFLFLGLQSHSSHHPCPYCTAARYNKNGKKTVTGDWGEGEKRTPDSIRLDNTYWLRKGRKATKKRPGVRGGGGVRKKLAQEEAGAVQQLPVHPHQAPGAPELHGGAPRVSARPLALRAARPSE